MCRLKSGIILKNRVFVPEYDSHTKMLEELGIKDDYFNARKTFVRVELSPIDGDVFSDIGTWRLTVDQDITPEWYDEDIYKPQVVEAVKEWAKDHIHIGVDNLKINTGRNHYIKDCKDIQIYGSATVENICGSATVEYICGSATVEYICGSATVECIYDSATVECIYDSATVENIYGSATVENIYDSATVENIYGSATVENIYDSATVENIYGSATAKNIYGSATVECIYDSATVEYICDSATVKNAKGMSVIVGGQYGWNKKETLILAENATFKDCETRTIYQSGNWALVGVESGNKIEKE